MISAKLVKELREKTGAGMLDCKKALEQNNGNIEESANWLREKGISQVAKRAHRVAAEGIAEILIKDNKAVVVEVNSETDFVAKNEEFKELVKNISETIINSDVTTMEEAMQLKFEGETLEELMVAKTSKIGEKLNFRRFEVITKENNQVFGDYIHMGGKIAVLTVLNDTTEEIARDVAMHTAAMRPLYITKEDVPEEEITKEMHVLTEQAINEGKPQEIAKKMVAGRIKKYFTEICLEEQPFVKDGDITVAKFVANNGGSLADMIRYEVGEGIEKREEDFACEVFKQMKNS